MPLSGVFVTVAEYGLTWLIEPVWCTTTQLCLDLQVNCHTQLILSLSKQKKVLQVIESTQKKKKIHTLQKIMYGIFW